MFSLRTTRLPLRLPLLFGLLTLIPAVALGWLTLDLLQKDRDLENERLRERIEGAADRVVAASHQRLQDLERLLASGREIQPDVVRVIAADGHIEVDPPGALAYYPEAGDSHDGDDVFAEGEQLEYREKDMVKAADWFARLAAADGRPAVVGGALLRLARNQMKVGDIESALATYERLATVDATVDGAPAQLLALMGRATLLEGASRTADVKASGTLLLKELTSSRWRLDRTSYESFLGSARQWSGEAGAAAASAKERAAAVFVDVYERWTANGTVRSRGWSIVDGGPALVAADGDARRLTVVIAGGQFLREAWRETEDVDVVLSDTQGAAIQGTVPKSRFVAVRTPDTTGLPWTVKVAASGLPNAGTEATVRGQLRLWGLAMMVLLIAGSAYVTWRGVSRELAVARLQADFVAAVSHEFRTPLASLRHLSEMLAKRRVSGDDQQQCYDHLARESERLERLVEELLDFGRLEEGKYQFRFESVDLAALVRDVTRRFQEHTGARGHAIECSCQDDALMAVIDRGALARALWNLLDNAAKYSPDVDTIWVQLSIERGVAVISVRDQGIGIDAGEQRQIFGKFVRGSRTRNISGTGLGLAMVRHIVDAHRGSVSVESQPNKGSTFAMRLPVGATA